MVPNIRPINRLFIANRGEIAVRIIRACKDLGIETVIGVSDADRGSLGSTMADRAICVGAAPAPESYLRADFLISAALGTGCDAVHPGYGFLSEKAQFADACAKEGLTFVGPPSRVIEMMGDKISAVHAAGAAGVPTLPCSPALEALSDAMAWANRIGYPCIIKASAGGGGRGMRIVGTDSDVRANFTSARTEAEAAFGNATVYLEKYVQHARHIEAQVIADRLGAVCHLFERDCTVQRRHQKLVEEAPSPILSEAVRLELLASAVALAEAVEYQNVGTIEYLYDIDEEKFYFLEMNTRLQVEHPVTELVTGIDIVQEQIRISEGYPLSFIQEDVECVGSAIECRINAEDPKDNFHPSPGGISEWCPPGHRNVRMDTHCFDGYLVPPYYDSLLAKLIVHSPDRKTTIHDLAKNLEDFKIGGVKTTKQLLTEVISCDDFGEGDVTTTWLEQEFLPRWIGSSPANGGLQT